jgi:hypothetical protein
VPTKVAVYYPVEPPDVHSADTGTGAGAGAGAGAGGSAEVEVEVHGYIRDAVLDCVKNKVHHVYHIHTYIPVHIHTYLHTTYIQPLNKTISRLYLYRSHPLI